MHGCCKLVSSAKIGNWERMQGRPLRLSANMVNKTKPQGLPRLPEGQPQGAAPPC